MTDQPTEVAVVSQTTPASTPLTDTVGAVSAHDPAMPSAAAVSAAALSAQLQQFLSAPTDGPRFNGGVATQSAAPTGQGFPQINYHVGGWGYTIPIEGR